MNLLFFSCALIDGLIFNLKNH